MKHRIYVASSWRNRHQPRVVSDLREHGYEVYDFRHPEPGSNGFAWSDIDPAWQSWSPAAFRDALDHPVAKEGFRRDFDAMQWADVFVLVLPCGRSAHLEAGWAIGAGKPTLICLAEGEPELMYRMANLLCIGPDEVVPALDDMLAKRDREYGAGMIELLKRWDGEGRKMARAYKQKWPAVGNGWAILVGMSARMANGCSLAVLESTYENALQEARAAHTVEHLSALWTRVEVFERARTWQPGRGETNRAQNDIARLEGHLGEPEPCSCDESLALRERLATAELELRDALLAVAELAESSKAAPLLSTPCQATDIEDGVKDHIAANIENAKRVRELGQWAVEHAPIVETVWTSLGEGKPLVRPAPRVPGSWQVMLPRPSSSFPSAPLTFDRLALVVSDNGTASLASKRCWLVYGKEGTAPAVYLVVPGGGFDEAPFISVPWRSDA